MGISITKIRRPWDRFIFITRRSVPVRQHLYIVMAPGQNDLRVRSNVKCTKMPENVPFLLLCVCCKYGMGEITIVRQDGTETTVDSYCPSVIETTVMIRTMGCCNPLICYGITTKKQGITDRARKYGLYCEKSNKYEILFFSQVPTKYLRTRITHCLQWS